MMRDGTPTTAEESLLAMQERDELFRRCAVRTIENAQRGVPVAASYLAACQAFVKATPPLQRPLSPGGPRISDRDLLEAAARGGGDPVVAWHVVGGIEVARLASGAWFQPLEQNSVTDCMGDALRLAVRCRLCVDTAGRLYSRDGDAAAATVVQMPGWTRMHQSHGADADRATRRAIVIAAAGTSWRIGGRA